MHGQHARFVAGALAAVVGLWCGAEPAPAGAEKAPPSAEKAPPGALLVVAHPDVQEQELDKATLGSLLLGHKQKWADGAKVVIVMPQASDDLEVFLKGVIGKTPGQFDMHWKRLVFTGKGLMPKTVETAAGVVADVRLTRGAIGLVPAGTKTDGVKVLPLTP